MELSSQDGEIPIPINSSYGGHLIHHHDPSLVVLVPHSHSQNHNTICNSSPQSQLLPSSNVLIPTATPTDTVTATTLSLDHYNNDQVIPYSNSNSNSKKVVKYRECLKNHAAAMGGTATDGCGEFMPSGEEGSIEALTCSACNCHRNFHRKEVEGEPSPSPNSFDHYYHHPTLRPRSLILGHHNHNHNHKNLLLPPPADALPLGLGYPTPTATPTGTLISSRPPPHHHMMMPSSYNINMMAATSDQSDEQDHQQQQQLVKKRFRTKFSQEQKDKMLSFAEKVGWRIQKQEESVVQQFCQEIGVKRRVLKVWMHNNKHNLAKKHSTTTTTAPLAD